ncbi:MAG: hypothetical protein N2690_09900, partial [Rhodocyclaceae bacterium]|nr:hypothetical protein [Rhodocyclaceae bacterium]
MADIPSLEIGNSRDLAEVRAEVHRLVGLIAPGHDLGPIDAAFALMDAACEGRLDGFLPLATPYHDQAHLMEVVLCSARLLHGLFLAGRPIEALTIDACLIGALLHDSGYLIRRAEVAAWPGSGAQFTLTHVVRGVVFAETQLGQVLPPALMSALAKVILTTDHRPVAAPLHYDSSAERLAAQVTATADLIGQMSSREYLERLLLLYYEFKEAGIGS